MRLCQPGAVRPPWKPLVSPSAASRSSRAFRRCWMVRPTSLIGT
jgi:hypothetical protein